jgi:hypothetical protein
VNQREYESTRVKSHNGTKLVLLSKTAQTDLTLLLVRTQLKTS